MSHVHLRRLLAPPVLVSTTVLAMLGVGSPPALAGPSAPAAATGPNSAHNIAGMGTVTGIVTDAATGRPIAGARVDISGTATLTGADGKYTASVPAGPQSVDATAHGYAPQTVEVTVGNETAVTKNFTLQGIPSVLVKGKVLDGSGQGWPVYAKVSVAGAPGGVYTNPATGEYTLSVPKGVKANIVYTPTYAGYAANSVFLPAPDGDMTLDAKVKVDAACNAAGYKTNFGTPVINEPFDTANMAPSGWQVSNSTNEGGWVFNDPKARGNMTGGTGTFAMIDSDGYGSGRKQDSSLISPVMNLTSIAAPVLKFNSDYRTYKNDVVTVDVTSDGGTTWNTLWKKQAGESQRGPVVNEISLAEFGGQAAVQVRFRYVGTYDYWWEVDNVSVQNRSCDAVSGGLILGNVTDFNTGLPLNGAGIVSVNKATEKATTVATPNDPMLDDGFYWLFSSMTGTHPFSTSKATYATGDMSVDVPDHGAVRVNHALKAPRLAVESQSLEMFQSIGQNRNAYVTVRNTGSAPADVTLGEQPGTTTPTLDKKGAGVRSTVIAGGVSKGFVRDSDKGHDAVLTHPSLDQVTDGSWSDSSAYPVKVSDNTAVSHGGKIYSLGDTVQGANTKKLWVYDPTSNQWSAAADAPSERSKPQLAAVGDKLYAFGGFGAGGNNAKVDVYTPATNSWETLAVVNPSPRAAAGTVVLNNKIYLIGGCIDVDCAASDEVAVFDPATSSFSTAARYPHGSAWLGCAVITSKAYCAGGVADNAHVDGYVYDPAANTWTQIADLPIDLWGASETAANGQLILMSGITGQSSQLTNRAFAYNPAGNSWQELPESRVPTARGAGACGTYKIGGWTEPFVPSESVERLANFDQCAGLSEDVAWLTQTPATFQLQAGKSAKVLVQLSAMPEKGIKQPGDYTAQLIAGGITPYEVPTIDVLMHALPPSSWSRIQGSVVGITCAGTEVSIPAVIQVNGAGSNKVTLKTETGKWEYWVPRGKYQFIVAKDGWIPQTVEQTTTAGQVHSVHFVLRPSTSCGQALRNQIIE